MKTTVVPAQVTTVEDKIAGNLNFTQLLLLTTPVFLSGAIFAMLPPFMTLKTYKLVLCTILTVICVTLAVRIKGKILLLWISTIGRYNLRPRYYVYNKNDQHLRNTATEKQEEVIPKAAIADEKEETETKSDIPLTEIIRLESAVLDPRANFHFKTNKKGVLSVSIQEIK